MEPQMSLKQFAGIAMSLFLLCFASPGWAQTGKGALSGVVVDAQDRALQGARIVAQPGESSAISDAQGQFTLNGLNAGDYDVTVSYAGFALFPKKVTVGAGRSARQERWLR